MSEQKRKMIWNIVAAILLLSVLIVTALGIRSVIDRKERYANSTEYVEVDYLPDGYTYTRDAFFDVQYIRTNGYREEMEYPMVKIIRSRDELNAYYEEYKDDYYLERKEQVFADTTIGFLDACDRYNEEYFKDQILILVLLEEGSGSIRHEVSKVRVKEKKGERTVNISINTRVPETVTDDMAQWHLLIELEEGLDVEDESHINVGWRR